MNNYYQDVLNDAGILKFKTTDFLASKYDCPNKDQFVDFWSPLDYVIRVHSGRKTFYTSGGSYTATAGDIVYFKKGGGIIEQYLDETFCLTVLFISDNLIRSALEETLAKSSSNSKAKNDGRSFFTITPTPEINQFFGVVDDVLMGLSAPPKETLSNQTQAFIQNLCQESSHLNLACHFYLTCHQNPKISRVMLENFRFNLGIVELATLCNRSLSSFKRDFKKQFNETPNRWLIRNRLEYAAGILRSTPYDITRISFESGFNNLSHFSRIFKNKYKKSPTDFRNVKTR